MNDACSRSKWLATCGDLMRDMGIIDCIDVLEVISKCSQLKKEKKQADLMCMMICSSKRKEQEPTDRQANLNMMD